MIGHPQEAVALAELEVLVAAADHPRRRRRAEGQRAERVVGVDDEVGAARGAHLGQSVELRDDPRVLEEHRRHQHRGGAVVGLNR